MVPVLGVLNSFTHGPSFLDILVPLAAIIFFLGGLIRMLFAALFEEGAPKPHFVTTSLPVSQLGMHAPAALPPAQNNLAPGWRSRPNTSEIRQPSSVTENTTRLLDKEDTHR